MRGDRNGSKKEELEIAWWNFPTFSIYSEAATCTQAMSVKSVGAFYKFELLRGVCTDLGLVLFPYRRLQI